jgi:hypothetical protein
MGDENTVQATGVLDSKEVSEGSFVTQRLVLILQASNYGILLTSIASPAVIITTHSHSPMGTANMSLQRPEPGVSHSKLSPVKSLSPSERGQSPLVTIQGTSTRTDPLQDGNLTQNLNNHPSSTFYPYFAYLVWGPLSFA